MKHFLPEQYVQLNSPIESESEAAELALERASEQYSLHWQSIEPRLPSCVRQFYQEQNLHDADVFAPAVVGQPMLTWQPGDIVIAAQQISTLYAETHNTLIFLHYRPTRPASILLPIQDSVFRASQPTWLYDEFDLLSSRDYCHRVLLSDGREITIYFDDFRYHVANLLHPNQLTNLGSVLPPKAASA